MFGKNYILPMFLSRMQDMALPGQGGGRLFPASQYTGISCLNRKWVDRVYEYLLCNIFAYTVEKHNRRNKKDRLSVSQRAGHY